MSDALILSRAPCRLSFLTTIVKATVCGRISSTRPHRSTLVAVFTHLILRTRSTRPTTYRFVRSELSSVNLCPFCCTLNSYLYSIAAAMDFETSNQPKIAGSPYGVLRRLGIKYSSPAVARPKFPADAKDAKAFWRQLHGVHEAYRAVEISKIEALKQTTEIVRHFGPLVWGTNRANLVSSLQEYVEYPRHLFWSSEETQALYSLSVFVLVIANS
jgi:hypothetical protein